MEQKFTNAPVDIDSLPDYQELTYTQVSVKRLYKVFLVLGLFVLAFAIGLYFLREVTEVPGLIWGLMITGLVIFGLLFFFQIMFQKRIGYALREHDIAYKRGFLFEKITIIPFNRIQHISTSESMLDKVFKISNLNIFTAGGSGSDIDIPGLTPEIASRLKNTIANHLIDIDE
ncbi:PH domain-containing protein [Leeuwenhoekiella sp. W20_SRS_FM14]|uniref:PH domain-containing protein n=1 Tax=Leeuwenhoekiella sp. W20_SRS_FM14 TaxID=3240270 RepID=UPI003F97B2E0